MAKYRKKPVVIEAHVWNANGDHPLDYPDDDHGAEYKKRHDWEGAIVRRYRHPNIHGTTVCGHETCKRTMHEHGWIDTLEGGYIVCPGDMIITGIAGENYPCKPDIFNATYEPVSE